jgi:hypothetical protein
VREDLLICVDHEGGRVQRFRTDGFTQLPPMRALGALWMRTAKRPGSGAMAATNAATAAGYVLGSELRACGVDFSFTPCWTWTGVAAVIGDRAFHADPRVVAMLAKSLAHGLLQAGMANCGKHFPGHGFVRADSHTDIPWTAQPQGHSAGRRCALCLAAQRAHRRHARTCDLPQGGQPPGGLFAPVAAGHPAHAPGFRRGHHQRRPEHGGRAISTATWPATPMPHWRHCRPGATWCCCATRAWAMGAPWMICWMAWPTRWHTAAGSPARTALRAAWRCCLKPCRRRGMN